MSPLGLLVICILPMEGEGGPERAQPYPDVAQATSAQAPLAGARSHAPPHCRGAQDGA